MAREYNALIAAITDVARRLDVLEALFKHPDAIDFITRSFRIGVITQVNTNADANLRTYANTSYSVRYRGTGNATPQLTTWKPNLGRMFEDETLTIVPAAINDFAFIWLLPNASNVITVYGSVPTEKIRTGDCEVA
jgi:hypothetical protein